MLSEKSLLLDQFLELRCRSSSIFKGDRLVSVPLAYHRTHQRLLVASAFCLPPRRPILLHPRTDRLPLGGSHPRTRTSARRVNGIGQASASPANGSLSGGRE